MAANPNFIGAVLSAYIGTASPFKAMLVGPDYTPDPASESGVSGAAAHEIAGVARIDLANVTVATDTEEARLVCDNLVFDGAGLDGTPDVGGVVIYEELGATDDDHLIVSWDVDDGPFTPPAGPLTYIVDDGFAIFSV